MPHRRAVFERVIAGQEADGQASIVVLIRHAGLPAPVLDAAADQERDNSTQDRIPGVAHKDERTRVSGRLSTGDTDEHKDRK